MATQPIHAAVVDRLNGHAPLTAIVADRIQPARMAGETALPYLTWQLISTPIRERTMGPTFGLAQARLQLVGWDKDMATAYDIAAEVHAALRGYAGTNAGVEIVDSHPDNEDDAHDESGEAHGRRVDYLIWYREP